MYWPHSCTVLLWYEKLKPTMRQIQVLAHKNVSYPWQMTTKRLKHRITSLSLNFNPI